MVEGTEDGDYYRGEVTGVTQAQVGWVRAPAGPRTRPWRPRGRLPSRAPSRRRCTHDLRAPRCRCPPASTELLPATLTADGALSVGETILFAVVALIAVTCGLGLLTAKRAVSAAANMIGIMICLAVLYITSEAPFLGITRSSSTRAPS